LQGVRSILVNSGHLVAARTVNLVLRLVYVVVVARVLGPELYGALTQAQALYLVFVPLALLGTDVTVARHLGAADGAPRHLVPASLHLVLACAAASVLVCAALAGALADDGLSLALGLTFCAALFARAVALWSQSVFTGLESARLTLTQEGLFRTLEVVVGLVVLALGGGVLAVALVHAASWTCQGAYGLWVVRRSFRLRLARPVRGPVLELVRAGLLIACSSLLWLLMLQLPLVMARPAGLPPEAVGQLAVVLQLWLVAIALPQALLTSALPVLARSVARSDAKDVGFVEVVLAFTLAAGAGAAVLADAVGPPVVTALLGDGYGPAAELLAVPVALIALNTTGWALQNALLLRDRAVLQLVAAGVGALTVVTCLLLAGARWGAAGPLLSAGVGMLAWNGTLLVAGRRIGVRLHGKVAAALLVALAAGLVRWSGVLPSGWSAAAALVLSCLFVGWLLRAVRSERRQALTYT
jgi:O-antigen/teichoic acid export membrane protein